MTTDANISKLVKASIETKIIEAFRETPEMIDELVRACLEQEVNDFGGKPQRHSDKRMPYLTWLAQERATHPGPEESTMNQNHPDQPLIIDDDGVVRFKKNAIVRFLLDAGPFDLNTIALMPFEREDREQLAQLIGYSVNGFGELNYAHPDKLILIEDEADKLANPVSRPLA